MPSGIFFYVLYKLKKGIYTVDFSLLKELFCTLFIEQIMENRKIKQKWFCILSLEICTIA